MSVPGDEQAAFAHGLAQELVDGRSSVDLRSISIVTKGDIEAVAARLGPERAGERVATLDAAEARLRAAREARDSALTRRDVLTAAIARLTDDAVQCDRVVAHAEELNRLIARAAAEAEARRRDVEAAQQRLNQVLEQRHAGQLAVERAERELAMVTGGGRDELELRRSLEEASRATHDLTMETKAAERAREGIERQQRELADRRAALAVERDAIAWVTSITADATDRVAHALEAVDARPSAATPSLRARALADAIAAVEAHLALVSEDERLTGSERLATLTSQHAGLVADATVLLGEDAGDQTVARLRAIGQVPRGGVDGVVAALAALGVASSTTDAVQRARTWLVDVRSAMALTAKYDEEAALLDRREVELARQTAEVEATHERLTAALDASRTETETVTAALAARAGGNDGEVERVADAQRLLEQVAAVRGALDEAEAAARGDLDRAIQESSSADEVCDRNERLLGMAGRRAQDLAAALPTDLRPELGPRPLDGLAELAQALRESLRRHQRELATETTAVAHSTEEVEDATRAVQAAQALVDGDESDIDMADALTALLAENSASRIIFQGALDSAGTAMRQALVAAAAEESATRALIVLTDDPDVLGWAIGLPPDVGGVSTTEAVTAAVDATAQPESVNKHPMPVETAVPGGSPG